MTSPDLDLMSGLLLRLKGNFPIRIMGSNQYLDRMSIKTTFIRIQAGPSSLAFWDDKQARRPRARGTTLSKSSQNTGCDQFRKRNRP